jgi:hypothetical protein
MIRAARANGDCLKKDPLRMAESGRLAATGSDRIGNDGLSMGILDEALAYLRQKHLIER